MAALTALSTSALSPSWTWMMGSPVAGFRVGKVLPDTLVCHSLLMKIPVCCTVTVTGYSNVMRRGQSSVTSTSGAVMGCGRAAADMQRGAWLTLFTSSFAQARPWWGCSRNISEISK